MILSLSKYTKTITGEVTLNSSKSESNRALLIKALGNGIELHNLSNARDTVTMNKLLNDKGSNWDVLDAGTTMRFCTAYLALTGDKTIITGTDRMKERPIGLLVEALRKVGSIISYTEKDGYPPLQITKLSEQQSDSVSIPGNVSSQYISALLMIAPSLPRGLQVVLEGEVFSRPYIDMTLMLMQHFGVDHTWEENTITVHNQQYEPSSYSIEGDWSGASYWYSVVALNPGSRLLLRTLKSNSLQGDQEIAAIMNQMGVKTTYSNEGALLENLKNHDSSITLDFRKCPDLAQTVMVTAALKGISLEMTGLESLRIKETDRIAAMQNELRKIGGNLSELNGRWRMEPSVAAVNNTPQIETYEDHRMAMAFAPVSMIRDIDILDPEVVKKSYPMFWEHLRSLGLQIESK